MLQSDGTERLHFNFLSRLPNVNLLFQMPPLLALSTSHLATMRNVYSISPQEQNNWEKNEIKELSRQLACYPFQTYTNGSVY